MKREILFRGKRTDNGEVVYGHFTSGCLIEGGGEEIENGNAVYLKDGGMLFVMNLGEGVSKNSALFSIKHLFSIVDGRLSTNISDIQVILGVYCGRSVYTHEVPAFIDEIKSAKPDWYMQAKGLVDYIKWMNYTDDFVKLMDILDKDFSNVYIMVEEKL